MRDNMNISHKGRTSDRVEGSEKQVHFGDKGKFKYSDSVEN